MYFKLKYQKMNLLTLASLQIFPVFIYSSILYAQLLSNNSVSFIIHFILDCSFYILCFSFDYLALRKLLIIYSFLITMLIIISFSIIYLIYIPFSTMNLYLFFSLISLIIQISIIFLVYVTVKEGSIVYIIEIDNEIIKKFNGKRSRIEFNIAQINRISFLHDDPGNIVRQYTITFEFLKGDKIELFYSHKYEEMVNFLIFLEKFCLKYSIEFQKIKKSLDKYEIKDMSEYLIIDKKNYLSDWMIGVGFFFFYVY